MEKCVIITHNELYANNLNYFRTSLNEQNTYYKSIQSFLQCDKIIIIQSAHFVLANCKYLRRRLTQRQHRATLICNKTSTICRSFRILGTYRQKEIAFVNKKPTLFKYFIQMKIVFVSDWLKNGNFSGRWGIKVYICTERMSCY